jgi:hypothetical protein
VLPVTFFGYEIICYIALKPMENIDLEMLEVFTPDNLCARCNKGEQRIFVKFYNRHKSPDSATYLGFCSHSCRKLFCAGIEASKYLPES